MDKTVQGASRDSTSTEFEEVSNEYKKQIMESGMMIEARYQAIVKEIKQKLKSEETKTKNLLATINDNQKVVEGTKKLERELQANALVLKTTKSELDIAECKLEKATILEKQRENDLTRLRREGERIETENERLEAVLAERARSIEQLQAQCFEFERVASKAADESKKQKQTTELKISHMRKEMHTQCIEMQEDMSILSGRLQEMSAISKKYETTEKQLFETANEAKILAENVVELRDKLTLEIAGREAAEGEARDAKKEAIEFAERAKQAEGEKWATETQNERLAQQLKEARVECFELTKTCDKKDKIAHGMNLEIAKLEQDLRNMEVMYKDNVEYVAKLKSENRDLTSTNTDLTSENARLLESELEKRALESRLYALESEHEKIAELHEKEIGEIQREKAGVVKSLSSFKSENERAEVNNCALEIKIKQLAEEQAGFAKGRRELENQIAEGASRLEQAEHDQKRAVRKFEFVSDELEQMKSQFDKERFKFEQATRDSIQLQDQVTCLRSQVDSLTLQLQEAENRSSKSLSKSDRMKEKIKAYQKNLADAHGEEMENLHSTIEQLTEKLNAKEKHFRVSELEKTIVDIQNKSKTDKEVLESLSSKLERLEREKLDLESQLNQTKRKRDEEELDDENKENIDPNAKKTRSKKQRVILGEKTNVQVPVKRSTRAKKPVSHNKTML